MIPASLSASSIQVYETCSARWKAEYSIAKGAGMGGSAANLGTACHEALERWVTEGHYLAGMPKKSVLLIMSELYDTAYWKCFPDNERYGEGLKMCLDWVERQDWEGRKVLSAETKDNFVLKTSAGEIPFNYIWDRCDELDNGDIEITDYKSIMVAITADDLRRKIQARLYGVAAQIKFPQAKRIWVTFDLLRHTPVGVCFKVEENREAYRYLQNVAERIIADDGTTESLNPDCRYCIRRHSCAELLRHSFVGGPLGITDPAAAADRRAQLAGAKSAMEGMIAELDEVIVAYLNESEIAGFDTERNHVEYSVQNRRQPPDPVMLRRVLPDGILASHGKLTVTEIDNLLKGSELDAEQKAALKKLVRTAAVGRGISVKPLSPIVL